jgi:hypothetical protein
MEVRQRIASVVISLLAAQLACAGVLDNLSLFTLGGARIDINIQHPPVAHLKVTTTAIASAEGQCSDDLAARVEEDLVLTGVTVIDRQHLTDVLAEHKLQVGARIDQKTAARLGALLGAQALIFLKVLDCHVGEEEQLLGTDKNGRAQHNYIARGNIGGTVRVLNLETGQVLVAQRFEGMAQARNFDGPPDPGSAMTDATKNAAFSVHKLLLPWKETKRIVFYNDSQCDLRVASDLARSQDIDGALKQSETNAAGCKDKPRVKPSVVAHAYYNLGILQFVKDEFDSALVNLSEAQKLDSSQIYTDAIADTKRARELAAVVDHYEEESVLSGAPSHNVTRRPIDSSSSAPTVSDRLAWLDDLLRKKLITQEEYNAKRAKILAGL